MVKLENEINNKLTEIENLETEKEMMEKSSKGGGSSAQTLTTYNQPPSPNSLKTG